MILSAILGIITPLAGKLVTAYVEPKITPVLAATKGIEKKYKNISNDLKHDKLVKFIETTPQLKKFVNKCGWNMAELDIIVKFCVLMAKKPLTDDKTKWNDDDYKVLADFAKTILLKWVKVFKK
jgi:hypothetical protein